MNISKHTKYQYEIIRLATHRGYVVVGGLSKILKYFIESRRASTILAYADKRFSVGNGYKLCGFAHIGDTKPGYKYAHSNTKAILSRQQCQKHKLSKLLGDSFRPDLSETQNMMANNYIKLWDASHMRLVYKRNMPSATCVPGLWEENPP